AHKGGDTQIENRIRQILDEEVRPAVAMDGGDITFERFENGTVYLFLQGSCSGCPSSTATLKVGIETRLRQAIPEVKEVVSV
ncbi:MAG: NifU family protein, partial [Bdellovibrionota bacterium]